MANTQKVMTLEDTAKLIAKVHANATGGAKFEYDNAKGEYGNIAAYMAAHKDGKVYGVKFPKYTYSNTPTGVKTRDNANLTIEISTNAKAGRDDYAPLNAFRTWDVNATVDDDGVPHVTAIDGIDTRFKRDGSNGDVYVMTCPGYYKLESTSTHNEFLYSDTQYDGYAPLPGVLLPDGSKRPCLLFAKYAASLDSQQRPLSVSGKEIDREFGSQNRAIDYALKKGKGYAGRCAGDTFYVQLMLMLKYATKNSDVLGGCWQYTPQTAVTKAETGVKRVIIATSYANNFDVGSTVNVGTDKERNNAGNYSAARARTILSKTAIDDSNTALNLDGTPHHHDHRMLRQQHAVEDRGHRQAARHRRPPIRRVRRKPPAHPPTGHRTVQRHLRKRRRPHRQRRQGQRQPRPHRTLPRVRHHQGIQDLDGELHQDRRIRRTRQDHERLMALRRGLHPVQWRNHPHGTGRDEHHRHVRRHRSQPAHIPRPPTGAALRQPLGWGAVRRFRREPRGRPRGPLVELRGPPVCARSHEGVAAVRWG